MLLINNCIFVNNCFCFSNLYKSFYCKMPGHENCAKNARFMYLNLHFQKSLCLATFLLSHSNRSGSFFPHISQTARQLSEAADADRFREKNARRRADSCPGKTWRGIYRNRCSNYSCRNSGLSAKIVMISQVMD